MTTVEIDVNTLDALVSGTEFKVYKLGQLIEEIEDSDDSDDEVVKTQLSMMRTQKTSLERKIKKTEELIDGAER